MTWGYAWWFDDGGSPLIYTQTKIGGHPVALEERAGVIQSRAALNLPRVDIALAVGSLDSFPVYVAEVFTHGPDGLPGRGELILSRSPDSFPRDEELGGRLASFPSREPELF